MRTKTTDDRLTVSAAITTKGGDFFIGRVFFEVIDGRAMVSLRRDDTRALVAMTALPEQTIRVLHRRLSRLVEWRHREALDLVFADVLARRLTLDHCWRSWRYTKRPNSIRALAFAVYLEAIKETRFPLSAIIKELP